MTGATVGLSHAPAVMVPDGFASALNACWVGAFGEVACLPSSLEFNIEKLQLVEAEKKKIRQEYERKEKQVDVWKMIEYSMQLNASLIKVLQAQDDVVK